MGWKAFFAGFQVSMLGLSFTPSLYTRVNTVYDGDTILLETGKKVRYLGIDAPEMADGSGREPEDRHNRKLAHLFLEDGRTVNAEMVKRRLAFVFL